ncbi:MAG TPA: tape measure protein [Armatimonadota bacterium]|jgi:tape measure domain-containing protein
MSNQISIYIRANGAAARKELLDTAKTAETLEAVAKAAGAQFGRLGVEVKVAGSKAKAALKEAEQAAKGVGDAADSASRRMSLLGRAFTAYGANARRTLADAEYGMKSLADSAGAISARLALVGGIGAAGMAVLGKTAMSTAANMEQTSVAFGTLLHSSDAARKSIQALSKFAAETPFEFGQVTQAAKQLLAYGFSAKELIPTLTSVGDAVSAVGAGAEGMDAVIRALGQMRAKGKVSQEEINQIGELGLNAGQILQREFHLTSKEMANIGIAGIDVEKAISAILRGFEKAFGGGMASQARTMNGIISNLKDLWSQFLANADADGLGDEINRVAKPALNDLLNEVMRLRKDGTLRKWAREIGEEFGKLAKAASEALKFLARHPDLVLSAAKWAGIATAVALAGSALAKVIQTALVLGPYLVKAAGGVRLLASAYVGLNTASLAAAGGSKGLVSGMASMVAMIPGWLKLLAAFAAAMYLIYQRGKQIEHEREAAGNTQDREAHYYQSRASDYMKAAKKNPAILKEHGGFVRVPEENHRYTADEWEALAPSRKNSLIAQGRVSKAYEPVPGAKADMPSARPEYDWIGSPTHGKTPPVYTVKARPGVTVWKWKGRGPVDAAMAKVLDTPAVPDVEVPRVGTPQVDTKGEKAAKKLAEEAAQARAQATKQILSLDQTPEGRLRSALNDVEETLRSEPAGSKANAKAHAAVLAAAEKGRKAAYAEFYKAVNGALVEAELELLRAQDTPLSRRRAAEIEAGQKLRENWASHAGAGEKMLSARQTDRRTFETSMAAAEAAYVKELDEAWDKTTNDILDDFQQRMDMESQAHQQELQDLQEARQARLDADQAAADNARRTIDLRVEDALKTKQISEQEKAGIQSDYEIWYDLQIRRQKAREQELLTAAVVAAMFGAAAKAAALTAQADAIAEAAKGLEAEKQLTIAKGLEQVSLHNFQNDLQLLENRKALTADVKERLRLEQQIAATKAKIAGIEEPGKVQPIDVPDAKEGRDDWRKEWRERGDIAKNAGMDAIRAFSDAFVNALTGAKGAWSDFWKSLTNIAKRALQDLVYAGVKNGIANLLSLGGQQAGGTGIAGAAAAIAGGPGSGPFGAPSGGKGIPGIGGLNKAFGKLLGRKLGASSLGGVALAGLAGSFLAPMLFGKNNRSGLGGGLGSAIGMAAGGPLGALAGGLIGGALGSLFKKRRKRRALSFAMPTLTTPNVYALGTYGAPVAPSAPVAQSHSVSVQQTINNYNPRPITGTVQELGALVTRAAKGRA